MTHGTSDPTARGVSHTDRLSNCPHTRWGSYSPLLTPSMWRLSPMVTGSVPQHCQLQLPGSHLCFRPTGWSLEASTPPPHQGLTCLMAHKTYGYWLVLHDAMKDRDEQPDEELHRVRSLESGGHPLAHGPLQFGFFMEPPSHRSNLLLLNTLPSPRSKKWGRDGKVQASNHGRCFW